VPPRGWLVGGGYTESHTHCKGSIGWRVFRCEGEGGLLRLNSQQLSCAVLSALLGGKHARLCFLFSAA
jgi:hypothetical protein